MDENQWFCHIINITKSQKYKDKEEKVSWALPVSEIYVFQHFFFFLTANIFALHIAEPGVEDN